MLDYALARLRPAQTFLVTESSTVWHFRQHMAETVSREFCTKYGFPVKMKVHELLSAGIQSPMRWSSGSISCGVRSGMGLRSSGVYRLMREVIFDRPSYLVESKGIKIPVRVFDQYNDLNM
jgi:hypothetical protein